MSATVSVKDKNRHLFAGAARISSTPYGVRREAATSLWIVFFRSFSAKRCSASLATALQMLVSESRISNLFRISNFEFRISQ